MAIDPHNLMTGETVILGKWANIVIDRSAYGLASHTIVDPFVVSSGDGTEAIGGKLYLTSYRLYFKSHFFNRVTGATSILLPNVTDIWTMPSFLSVSSTKGDFDFMVWGIPKLVEAIRGAMQAQDEAAKRQLIELADAESEKLGAGLQLQKIFRLFKR